MEGPIRDCRLAVANRGGAERQHGARFPEGGSTVLVESKSVGGDEGGGDRGV